MNPALPNNAEGSNDLVVVDPPLDELRRQHLFGLDFIDAQDLGPVLAAILRHRRRCALGANDVDGWRTGTIDVVVTPNVDILVSLDRSAAAAVRDLYRRARYVLPDGMPVVHVSKWLARPLRARLTGSGLFGDLWPQIANDRRQVVLLCSNDGIAEFLRAEHPQAEFVVPPFFQPTDSAHRALLAKELYAAIERVDADYLMLGIGHPKDALIAAAVLDLCDELQRPAPLCFCLGASFAMYVGQQRRAPDVVQRIGLEWFHRFVQEPRRLFKRYFIDDVAFIGLVLRERAMIKRAGSR